jgi:hypothetical protein
MEDTPNYGKRKKLKKEIQFEEGKSLIFEYDSSEMEEEAFARALEEAQRTKPKSMKEFLFALHNIFKT